MVKDREAWCAAVHGVSKESDMTERLKKHVCWVSDAIQPSHSLSPPSPPAPNLSQPQSLLWWVGFSHQLAKVIGASATVLPVNIQGWFLYNWLVWFPCFLWDSQESFPAPQFESISSLVLSLLYGPTLSSYMSTGKTIPLTIWAFVSKVMFLLFNMLSRFVIAFLPRSKYILISWLQSPSTVILEPTKI